MGTQFDLKVEFPALRPKRPCASRSTARTPQRRRPSPRPSWSGKTAATTRPTGSAARPDKAGNYTIEATAGDRRQRRLGGVRRPMAAQGQERDPVHRRRPVDRAPHGCARAVEGMVEGRYGGELAIDDMPHMALVSTSGTDRSSPTAPTACAPTRPATSPASTRWASTARATRTRSIIRRSRRSPSWSSARAAWRSASSRTPRSRTRRRPAMVSHTRRARRLQRHREDVPST